jgi:NAD(P)H-hydrate epimerase
MYVLTRNEMREIDHYTISSQGIPGIQLMETAGRGCAEYIQPLLPDGGAVALFCGTGNNGGDGLVIAHYLRQWGFAPTIFLLGSPDAMSPESSENLKRCKDLSIPLHELHSMDDWYTAHCDTDFCAVVDAIFGNGFAGVVRGWRGEIIQLINDMALPVYAIDIPSGVDADTGQAVIAIQADVTLTMAAPKYGHFLSDGRAKTGLLHIIDIGVPPRVYRALPPRGMLITDDTVRYPQRSPLGHKGDFGRIGIIAGSPGYSGAAVLASRAALRAGGGLITLFHPAGMEHIFEVQLTEVMTCAIPLQNDSFDLDAISPKLETMDVLLLGPGLSQSEAAEKLVEWIVHHWNKPLVIDADGLNILSRRHDLLEELDGRQVLLTPHVGEFARLMQNTVHEIEQNILAALEQFTSTWHLPVLLKSATTILAADGGYTLDISGNDGLATGGSGDVLAGIITSFIGQRSSIPEAAVAASYLLGTTAEKLAIRRAPASIIPSDIIENLFVS